MFLQILTSIFLFVNVKAAPSAVEPTSFVLVGDSTTANGYVNIGAIYDYIGLKPFITFHRTTPNSGGWGNGLCGSTITGNIASVAAGTPCINTAHNGATTGSFVADGWVSCCCMSKYLDLLTYHRWSIYAHVLELVVSGTFPPLLFVVK